MARLLASMLVAVAAAGTAPPARAEEAPLQIFVEDAYVSLDGWSEADATALGKALATDVQAVLVQVPGYAPLTFENLESHLRKERRAELLACRRDDQACIQSIVDDYGCEERVFTTVRRAGPQAQVTLTHYRGKTLVPGGMATVDAPPGWQALRHAARELARQLFLAGRAEDSARADSSPAIDVRPPDVDEPTSEEPRPGESHGVTSSAPTPLLPTAAPLRADRSVTIEDRRRESLHVSTPATIVALSGATIAAVAFIVGLTAGDSLGDQGGLALVVTGASALGLVIPVGAILGMIDDGDPSSDDDR